MTTAAILTALLITIVVTVCATEIIRSSKTRRQAEATPYLHAARAQEQITFYRRANRRLADENDRLLDELRQLKADRAKLTEQAKLRVRRYPDA